MNYSTFLTKALNSFEGFRGAKMPTNPTTEQEAKEEAKANALAKLSALGLTEEEVQAIIK